MNQQDRRFATIALALSVISILIAGYAIVVVQSMASAISDLQAAVSQLKSTVEQLSARVGKLEGAAPAPAAPVKLVVIGPWSGRRHVLENFVITRHVQRYLGFFSSLH